MTHLVRAALMAVALIAASTEVSAQLPFIHFGVGGGATVPTGSTRGAFDVGWHGELLATLRFPLVPVGLRADAVYHRLRAASGSGGSEADLDLYGAELSATWDVGLPMVPITPYLIGGAGYFRQRAGSAVTDGSKNTLGWSGGLGVRFGLAAVGAFAEARYLAIEASGGRRSFLPVTVGVTLK